MFCLLWDSVRRTVMSRWRACRGSLRDSRHPLQARRISFLETVPVRRTVDFHRTYPACCLVWTHYWIRSRQFWCSIRHREGDSPPRDGQVERWRWSEQRWIYFKISMDNMFLMKILNSRDDLSKDKSFPLQVAWEAEVGRRLWQRVSIKERNILE